MARTLKQLLRLFLNIAASLPPGLSPEELLLPAEELCQNKRERSTSMDSAEQTNPGFNRFRERPD
jgi:hypothetical protein